MTFIEFTVCCEKNKKVMYFKESKKNHEEYLIKLRKSNITRSYFMIISEG
jgi:hypothetical protein